MNYKNLTDAQWRERLTPLQYAVLREKGTERPFTGAYTDTEEVGVYACAGCGTVLFEATHKFHSGCGWASFHSELDTANIQQITDTSHGMRRVELVCSTCGGHLGHIFPDGPKPTGMRYCINSASLLFTPNS
jgi:peptide-methionine (R)-S-oxide reductase